MVESSEPLTNGNSSEVEVDHDKLTEDPISPRFSWSGVPLAERDSFPTWHTAHGTGGNVTHLSSSLKNKDQISICHDFDGRFMSSTPQPRLHTAAATPELISPTSSTPTTPPLPLSPQPEKMLGHDTVVPSPTETTKPFTVVTQPTPEAGGTPFFLTPNRSNVSVENSPTSSRSSSFTGPRSDEVKALTERLNETKIKPTLAPVAIPAATKTVKEDKHTMDETGAMQKSASKLSTSAGKESKFSLNKLFGSDKSDRASHAHPQSGDESESETKSVTSNSGGSALKIFGRRMSAGAMGKKLPNEENGKGHDAKKDTTGKLERKGSDLGQKRLPRPEDKHEPESLGNSLKDLVSPGKMTRKASVTSKKSDGGSDKGSSYTDDHYDKKSSSGINKDSASLLKKYGVCEKVAIGKGATAVVRLAHKWDRSNTERLYAVKEFRKRRKNETEREYVKKLTSEFCISSTLHHPYIVETVDLVQDESHHWCEVMEYCPGGDLYAAIKRGQMSQAEINSYFKQMMLGVTYLHSMGVAHRDIKPENLLIDAQGMVKITDFGVSDVFRMCWEKTTHLSKGLCGSEPYISPEQFEQKEYDARLVDVWACAIVFYCLNQQELPWRSARTSDESYQAFVLAYSSSPSPPPLHALQRECRGLLKHMLDPNPKNRWSTDSIVKDSWFTGLTIVDIHGKTVETPSPKNQKNPLGNMGPLGVAPPPSTAAA